MHLRTVCMQLASSAENLDLKGTAVLAAPSRGGGPINYDTRKWPADACPGSSLPRPGSRRNCRWPRILTITKLAGRAMGVIGAGGGMDRCASAGARPQREKISGQVPSALGSRASVRFLHGVQCRERATVPVCRAVLRSAAARSLVASGLPCPVCGFVCVARAAD